MSEALDPPWAVVWERSPIWFERWKPGGFSESPSRRLASGPESFVTVLRRQLYGLDRRTGRTVWTQPLQGQEIFDWRVSGDVLVYASYGEDEAAGRYWGIRSVMDLRKGKAIWTRTRPTPYLRKEWLLVHDKLVVYGDDRTSELAALALSDGAERWKVPQVTGDDYPVQASWFAYGDVLYALARQEKSGGLFLKSFDLATGRELPLAHLFGGDAVSNLYVPSAVTPDGRLFVEYDAFRLGKASIVAYDLEGKRLLWETRVLDGTESRGYEVRSGRTIVVSDAPEQPLVATYDPNRYLMLNAATGSILKDSVLPGYVGWTEHNAVIYRYPYLFTSARRALETGMAYDLIALNLETGKIDWAYEIDRQKERFQTAGAEILNFLVHDDHVYLSRTDARVMAFRTSRGSGSSP
ncbi:MAG: PQQ-binding-like beta-propeller repeat protein [Candidatus Rokubacteria bacterium]|nr:PQQ-binding-like beta-propeller repeat protein [Candidatus Rokubacteria bacterium]